MAELLITPAPFDPEQAQKDFRERLKDTGAITAFTGLVRGEDVMLTLSHYPDFTEGEIMKAIEEAKTRWALSGCCVIHRVGEMASGEPIVFVATASAHRRAAFEAADFLMDYLKSSAPLWKSETKNGTTCWIEPREQDIRDRQRWNNVE